MRTRILTALALLAWSQFAQAHGLLLPDDTSVPPLSMVSHKVDATIDEQVAATTVEQLFRNHTSRPVEATYVFPVPKGASINKFTMWIDGKETAGELLDAKKANQIYTEIVRRTRDPGILEYVGNDLLRMRVFPIPANSTQKVKLRFTHVAPKDAGVVEYIYPMKTDGRANRTLDEVFVRVTLKSQSPIQSVYSPTHAIALNRNSDREVVVDFEKNQALLDKDFQLFYATSAQPIGITPLLYRPISSEDGYFMFLISPSTEASKIQRVPRDLVMVLDKSGSMSDLKMAQAKKALKHCLGNLKPDDRFALVSFATTVSTFDDRLQSASKEQLERAEKWVDDLRQSGGTAILPALETALSLRSKGEPGRSFNIVFFTDGLPTVDETNPDKIVKAVGAKVGAETRIFTFGVGDDVNAAMLDQLADATRGVSTYVRPSEDIEAKVSSLYAKISHPVMTNVKLSASGVRLHEVYPVQLPDLFHGSQLVVIGRFSGSGPATVRLSGMIGRESKELVEEFTFPGTRTSDDKEFVEHLWARRKVGYILDQIRANGEKKELVDEVTQLAKKYGIATPYTSYLVVPDGPMPVATLGRSRSMMPTNGPVFGGLLPSAPGVGGPAAAEAKTAEVAKQAAGDATKSGGKDGIAGGRGGVQNRQIDERLKDLKPEDRKGAYADALEKAKKDQSVLTEADRNYKGNLRANQVGSQGVDLALASDALRNQSRLSQTATRAAYGRNCVEVGGVWIDEKYDAKMKLVAIKAQGAAYFRLLEKQPQLKDVYQLGNHIVWVTPSNEALVIDPKDGADDLKDEELNKLFAAAK
ncbi:VIT domain-containing protein [Limnoglobus roseus]|uniref:VWA domain-containing protein n=1 Tax=Limnoglobus roseus TaxID=2598579 RepID=A0A5C1AMI2_9BACT|nr:VIT domain-containing protein [Limnoglobus roseus]QEL18414.1 VWA domain-containing protein [Limnoglobus roseus]